MAVGISGVVEALWTLTILQPSLSCSHSFGDRLANAQLLFSWTNVARPASCLRSNHPVENVT